MKNLKVVDFLEAYLFNDIHAENLDLEEDGWYIIESVLIRSMDYEKDITTLEKIYHPDDIIHAALN